jgi:hypothetical protein
MQVDLATKDLPGLVASLEALDGARLRVLHSPGRPQADPPAAPPASGNRMLLLVLDQ